MNTYIPAWFQKNKTNILPWIKRTGEEILFWVQIIIPWVILVPICINILNGVVEGLTLTVYITIITFFILGFTLAISSYKKNRVKKRLQLVIVYGQLVVLIGAVTVVSINRIPWIVGDTITCIVVYSLSIATVGFSHLYVEGSIKDRIQDPIVRGLVATWCKGLPHIWFAWTMIDQKGSEGLPTVSLVAIYFNIFPRFIHIVLSGKKAGWDRATKGLFIGEFSNLITWVIASLVWAYFRI